MVEKGDHPTRLARTDERCKRSAMFRAKAFYFTKKPDLWSEKKETWIIGAGSAGKMAYQALNNAGYTIKGFEWCEDTEEK